MEITSQSKAANHMWEKESMFYAMTCCNQSMISPNIQRLTDSIFDNCKTF